MQHGQLFPEDYLKDGIQRDSAWHTLSGDEAEQFAADIRDIFEGFPVGGTPNEARTESEIIVPILALLGWSDLLPQQQAGRRRTDVPDLLLFESAADKFKADEASDGNVWLSGRSFVESKRWQRELDRRTGATEAGDDRVPSNQMLRYLSRVETASDRRIRWGILTNGRLWRLYFQGARSRAEEFLEIDLPLIARVPGAEGDLFSPPADDHAHLMKVFQLMFRREAFVPEGVGGRSFHARAREDGRLWEAKVRDTLSDTVFEHVFPQLVQALADSDPARLPDPTGIDLAAIKDAALILLYRILFLLYAEDRDLLPPNDTRYDDYSLRHIRNDIRDRRGANDIFSAQVPDYHQHLQNLFRIVHRGDDSIGIPAYNGGLFDPAAAPLLERVEIPDAVMAPVLDALSRREEDGRIVWINYRDLSVQQLGAVYESILEYEPVLASDGAIEIAPNKFARKGSGSYYTPDDLVGLIIERTVGPLVEEWVSAFTALSEDLSSDTRAIAARREELMAADPAEGILTLRICDPAMGSGHFLVSLVDWMADAVLRQIEESAAVAGWLPEDEPYVSPLMARIEEIRARIRAQADENGWRVPDRQLDDRHIVRRMILKRCVFGVDKNPMAVELAKVSLWLHTFTAGAPLSFLDHHLRCGDSLFGEWVRPLEDELGERYGLMINSYVAQARNAARGMALVEEITDADIAEVRQSAEAFEGVAQDIGPLDRFMVFMHAVRWLRAARDPAAGEQIVSEILDGNFGDPLAVIAGRVTLPDAEEPADLFGMSDEQLSLFGGERRSSLTALRDLIEKARALVAEQRFFNWQVAFPGVWDNWESARPEGGFDAVIGNPPWDRIKMQEVEWFAARSPEIAHAARAADRKAMIRKLENAGDPLAAEYDTARNRAEAAAAVARKSGYFPLLSKGDINIYALFVERAHALVKPDGLVGLLVPSGLASDKSASDFFSEIATGGRLAALLDFENKKVFFPDIDSRFKFMAYIAGGAARTFDESMCAFFLHAVAELGEPDRVFALSAAEFAAVNPNTGTAPVFRTRRDAAITTRIYKKFPVLVDRRQDPPARVWPVDYHTMFHMTNDSDKFRTRAELEAGGAYPVAGNRLKQGAQEFVPLYVGRMIHQFDHRAASVGTNPHNLHNPALSDRIALEDKQNPEFSPTPQYWVSTAHIPTGEARNWHLSFRDIARVTDVRTAIAAIIPSSAAGNTLPLVNADTEGQKTDIIVFLLANLNAFALDFVSRQKVQGTHLNWYILEQLPVIPVVGYARTFGPKTAGQIVRDDVLALTYTAHDMAPFARDMGYKGDPFPWDEAERRRRRARLDALYFLLYGVTDRDDVGYIMDTFPIVKREDEREFGRYLTRDLVLAWMNALEAGDPDAEIAM